jgi:aspartate racemase
MKRIGLLGGIGPESTIEYYRALVAGHRARVGDGSYPRLIVNSIDMQKMLGFVESGRLPELADYLVAEVHRLAAAGASLGLLASNTPHIVFGEVSARSPIPLVSIVEAACAEARALGIMRPGLFGTRFTMQGRFYQDVFSAWGIALQVPREDEQEYIHEKYMTELVPGVIKHETRGALLALASRMRVRDDIDGLILGGTELPLILRDSGSVGIPFLDTTRIHVARTLDLAAAAASPPKAT